MARDLMDDTYYISRGGKIPVRWTAPEVKHFLMVTSVGLCALYGCLPRLHISNNTTP